MLSQNVSQTFLLELAVSLCDIFKCEKSCFSRDDKKYVEAQYDMKDILSLNNSSLNSRKKRKPDVWKNTNEDEETKDNKRSTSTKGTCYSKIDSESESSEGEIDAESKSSREGESEDESDEDYLPYEEKKKLIKKKKPVAKKIKKSRSISETESDEKDEDYIDFSSENKSESESDSESESRRKRRFPTTNKRNYKKSMKQNKHQKQVTEKKELSEYEKLIQNSRDEKMAFLKSLHIDEIKEEIKREMKSNQKPVKRKNFKDDLLIRRKSARSLTKKKKNLSEDFIQKEAFSNASKEFEKIEEQRKRYIQKRTYRTRTQGLSSDSEEDNDKLNNSSQKKRLVEDFLIPALNDDRYGIFLRWTNRRQYCFSIRWLTGNNNLFDDYVKWKGPYDPKVRDFRNQSKQRFRRALKKLSSVITLPSKDRRDKKYQLDVEKIGKESLIVAPKPYQVRRHRPILTKDSTERSDNMKMVNQTFNCDFCGCYFYQKHFLIRHIMLHTGERPLSCEVCGLGFITKEKLNIHKRIHTLPLKMIPGTSALQSNATQGKTVLFVWKNPTNTVDANQSIIINQPTTPGTVVPTISIDAKPPTDVTNANKDIKLVPPATLEENSVSSSANLTGSQTTTCCDLGALDQSNATPLNTSLILKPSTDCLNAEDTTKMKQSPFKKKKSDHF